jgi:hypothetical protein
VIKRFPIKNKYRIRADKKKSKFNRLKDISIKLVYIIPDKIEIIIVSTIATTRLEKIILVLLCGVSAMLTKPFPCTRKSKNSLYRGGNITMDPRIKINPGKDHIS